jgi:sulfur carrier protein
MKIIVNGETHDVQSQTLEEILIALGHGNGKVATAVNEEFCPASLRSTVLIKEGDRIEIVAPRQGG